MQRVIRARKTSGRLDAPVAEIWSPAGSGIETSQPLWPWLVLLLLVLLPLDIAIRRLPF